MNKDQFCKAVWYVALLAFLFVQPLTSHAIDCTQYGWKAVQQTIKYNENRCSGGSPGWWSEDINYHKDWCERKLANPTGIGGPHPSDGFRLREDVLSKCLGQGGSCGVYADTAVQQFSEFQKMNCAAVLPAHEQGPSAWWSGARSYHFSWCNNPAGRGPTPQAGVQMREDVLAKCRAKARASSPPPGPRGNFQITLFAFPAEAKLGAREGLGIGWDGNPSFPLLLELVWDSLHPLPPGWPASITYTITGGSGQTFIPDAIRCDGPSSGMPVTLRYHASLKDSKGYQTSIQPASWTCVP